MYRLIDALIKENFFPLSDLINSFLIIWFLYNFYLWLILMNKIWKENKTKILLLGAAGFTLGGYLLKKTFGN